MLLISIETVKLASVGSFTVSIEINDAISWRQKCINKYDSYHDNDLFQPVLLVGRHFWRVAAAKSCLLNVDRCHVDAVIYTNIKNDNGQINFPRLLFVII